jgi:hypothetical protein
VFRTVPLTVFEWLLVLSISISVILVVEIDKGIRRRFGQTQNREGIVRDFFGTQ